MRGGALSLAASPVALIVLLSVIPVRSADRSSIPPHAVGQRPPSSFIPKRYACPSQVEPLIALMLRDLPGYANRAISRSTRGLNLGGLGSSVLLAGRPEFEPLPLSSDLPSSPPDPNLHQVFITTLERQTIGAGGNSKETVGKTVRLQEFHWLFLAQAQNGWILALMFTRTGTYPTTQPPTPPRESSQGAIGQAIRTWLRDCNAGVIRPIKSDNLFNKTR